MPYNIFISSVRLHFIVALIGCFLYFFVLFCFVLFVVFRSFFYLCTFFILFFFFFSFLFWPPAACGVSGLHRRSGNTASLTHYTGQGIEPASQLSRDAIDPVVPRWKILFILDSILSSFFLAVLSQMYKDKQLSKLLIKLLILWT